MVCITYPDEMSQIRRVPSTPPLNKIDSSGEQLRLFTNELWPCSTRILFSRLPCLSEQRESIMRRVLSESARKTKLPDELEVMARGHDFAE